MVIDFKYPIRFSFKVVRPDFSIERWIVDVISVHSENEWSYGGTVEGCGIRWGLSEKEIDQEIEKFNKHSLNKN